MEDRDGRITQGIGRIKRARGEKDDVDSVPLFAEPSMPLGETTREQSPPKENLFVATSPADKENSAPLSGEEEALAIPAKSHARSFSQESPEAPHNNWAPWEFKEEKQAEEFSTAMPFTSRRYGSGLPAYGFPTQSSDEKTSPVQEGASRPNGHKKNMSSLSATAKPFEFKPTAFTFTFGEPSDSTPAPVAPPSQVEAVFLLHDMLGAQHHQQKLTYPKSLCNLTSLFSSRQRCLDRKALLNMTNLIHPFLLPLHSQILLKCHTKTLMM